MSFATREGAKDFIKNGELFRARTTRAILKKCMAFSNIALTRLLVVMTQRPVHLPQDQVGEVNVQ